LSRGRALFLALAALALTGRVEASAALASPPLDDDEEPPALAGNAVAAAPAVAAIEVRSNAPLPEKPDLASLLDLAVGEPATDVRVRRTLRNVEASGLASEVEIYTRPADSGPGVVAILVLRAAVQVDAVKIAGQLGLPLTELENALEQQPDQPLEEDRVVRGVFALEDRYKANGYLGARVRVAVSTDPVRQRATVTYQVTAGPRATVASVGFDGGAAGMAPFTPAALVAELRTKPGAPYRQSTVREDSDRLERWLIRQGYNLARVDAAREQIDAEKNQVAVTFPVRIGPKLVLEVVGASRQALQKNGLLPFLGDEGYDDALVIQSVAKIKDYYQGQGHYHVKVASSDRREDGTLRLAITIEPGPVYTLKDIRFTGNRGVSGDQLASLMATSERRLLALGSGRLVDSELTKDLDNIRSYYALQGYPQAKVGPPQVD